MVTVIFHNFHCVHTDYSVLGFFCCCFWGDKAGTLSCFSRNHSWCTKVTFLTNLVCGFGQVFEFYLISQHLLNITCKELCYIFWWLSCNKCPQNSHHHSLPRHLLSCHLLMKLTLFLKTANSPYPGLFLPMYLSPSSGLYNLLIYHFMVSLPH